MSTSCPRIIDLLEAVHDHPSTHPTIISQNTCITLEDIDKTKKIVSQLSHDITATERDAIIDYLAKHLICREHGDPRAEVYHVLGVWLDIHNLNAPSQSGFSATQRHRPGVSGTKNVDIDAEMRDPDPAHAPSTTTNTESSSINATAEETLNAKLQILREALPWDESYVNPPFKDANIFWEFILDQNSYMRYKIKELNKFKLYTQELDEEMKNLYTKHTNLTDQLNLELKEKDEFRFYCGKEINRLNCEIRGRDDVIEELQQEVASQQKPSNHQNNKDQPESYNKNFDHHALLELAKHNTHLKNTNAELESKDRESQSLITKLEDADKKSQSQLAELRKTAAQLAADHAHLLKPRLMLKPKSKSNFSPHSTTQSSSTSPTTMTEFEIKVNGLETVALAHVRATLWKQEVECLLKTNAEKNTKVGELEHIIRESDAKIGMLKVELNECERTCTERLRRARDPESKGTQDAVTVESEMGALESPWHPPPNPFAGPPPQMASRPLRVLETSASSDDVSIRTGSSGVSPRSTIQVKGSGKVKKGKGKEFQDREGWF